MKPALKKLLNPGWILTIILVVGFSYTAFSILVFYLAMRGVLTDQSGI